MCHFYQENHGIWNPGYWLLCSSDNFVIYQRLKNYGYLQILKMGIFSLFTNFLVALLSPNETYETHCFKRISMFVSN